MKSPSHPHSFDVIVIGSGMGGMCAAAALSRLGHRVLLLEQAPSIGGLTHSFSREGFSWDVGLHYCGTFGHDQAAGRILDWLTGGTVEFQSVGTVYDTLHFPDDFTVPVGRPTDAYKMELKDRFPDHKAEIDAYFEALLAAEEAGHMVSVERALPEPFRFAHRWWNKKKIQRWCSRTTAEVIDELISDPKLAAVLAAQWGTYGGKPSEASFAAHGIVIGHYQDGAGYPVGGAGAIADALVPVIEAAGGSVRAGTAVEEILLEDGHVVGVRTQDDQMFSAERVISAIGAGETVQHLLPAEVREQEWAQEIASLRPSLCHFDLYLGFEGEIDPCGATRSNHWFYESWNPGEAIWKGGDDEPLPMLFVSFASLKDPSHDPGPKHRHTGDVLIWADWSSVAAFANGGAEERPEEWAAFKENLRTRMLVAFEDKFPALAPMIVYSELGTPLATKEFTGHTKGGFYGLETTPRRLLSDALNARTPVKGLGPMYLASHALDKPGSIG